MFTDILILVHDRRISVIYTKNETKLSRPIRPSADYDENQIGQQRD